MGSGVGESDERRRVENGDAGLNDRTLNAADNTGDPSDVSRRGVAGRKYSDARSSSPRINATPEGSSSGVCAVCSLHQLTLSRVFSFVSHL